jgi:hypothetical protein
VVYWPNPSAPGKAMVCAFVEKNNDRQQKTVPITFNLFIIRK